MGCDKFSLKEQMIVSESGQCSLSS